MAFVIYTAVCSHHLNLGPKHFHHPTSISSPSPFSPKSPTPGNHSSTVCLYGFASFGHFMWVESYNMWPFVPGFLLSAYSSQKIIQAVACVTTSFLFLWLNSFPLGAYTTYWFFCFLNSFGRTAQYSVSYFPDQGSNSYPLQWERRVLTTGPPGNSHISHTVYPFIRGYAFGCFHFLAVMNNDSMNIHV